MSPLYLYAQPTAVPAVLTAWASTTVKPLLSVPRLPSSVAAVPEASQRTARSPRYVPPAVLARVADGGAGAVDGEGLAVREPMAVGAEVAQLGGGGARGVPADGVRLP